MALEKINPPEQANFVEDIVNTSIRTIITVFVWYLFFYYYTLLLSNLIGLVVIFLVVMILLPYTIALVSQWFQVWAYQIVSWRRNLPYMNYKTKCPFLKRKRFSFSCNAEQIAPYQHDLIERCHRIELWEPCWSERIPSILEVYDEAPSRKKQQLAFTLAAMKEHAAPSGPKMLEVLNNEMLEINTRLSAGLALSAMNNENGIEPLLSMLGSYDQRTDQTIRAVLSRYDEIALPYLINALQDCDNDTKCGGIVEIMGKIGHPNCIPALEGVLNNEATGEFTKLQAIYAFQSLDLEEGYRKLITYFEKAPEDERTAIKEVFQARKLTSFPLLIELLSNRDISEDFYARIGDVLADVDTRTYDRFFLKIRETKGIEMSQRLAKILKENTPEEEEFLKLHTILDRHISYQDVL